MKIFINILLIFLAAILQISLFPKISIFSALPNLIFLATMILIFTNREDEALIWAGLGGILLDLFSPVRFGIFLFPLLVIYFLTSILVKRIFTDPNLIIAASFFFLGSIFFDILWIFINPQWQIILINAIYNTIVGIIIYWLLRERLKPKEFVKI